MARVGAALAPVSIGVFAAGGAGDAAGAFGAYRGELRFRGGYRSRLAHDDFSSLFRCRRDLFGLRDGADAGDSAAQGLWPGGIYHAAPPGADGESDAGHGADRGVRLLHRIFHGVLQREQVRRLFGEAATAWAVRAVLLRPDFMQHPDAATAVVQEGAAQYSGAVRYVADHQRRNVAGAVRDRGDFADARLHAFGVGEVFGDGVGLRDVRRHAGTLHDADFPVRARAAGDCDFGNARTGAPGFAWQ